MSDTFRRLASRLSLWVIAGAFLAACNLFNPSGSGSYPDNDPDAFIELGQRALQDLDYNSAWTNFCKALALDSTKSLAYQGLAKAEMGREGFSLATLVWLADSTRKIQDNTTKIVFVADLGLDTLNRIYRPLMKAAEVYRKLQARSESGKIDDAFGFHLVRFELEAITSSQVYFRMIDANGNWMIEPSEIRTLKMLAKLASSGSSVLDADTLMNLCKIDSTDGSVDSEAVANINGILANLATIAGESARQATPVGTDTNSAASQVSKDGQDFASGLHASTGFYLVNDSLDNDGDGCINEEIAGDSLDNDGDSLKEEDGRLGFRSTGKPTDGQTAMVSPASLSLKHVYNGDKNRLEVVGRSPDDLRWAGTGGLLVPYQGLRWVRWDEQNPSRNDTVFARVVREETNGSFTTANVGSSPDYPAIRTKAIIEIRKKVLAATDPTKRVELGKSIVGGCWDAY